MDKCFKQLNNPSLHRKPSHDCYQLVNFPKMDGWGRKPIPIKTPPAGVYPYLEKLAQSKEFRGKVALLDPIRIDQDIHIRGPEKLMLDLRSGKNKRFKIIPLHVEGTNKPYGGILYDSFKSEWELFTLPGVTLTPELKKHQLKILALIKEKFKFNPKLFYQHVGFRPDNSYGGVGTWWPIWLIYLKLKNHEKFRELRVNKALELLHRKPEMFDNFLSIFD